jgi:2-amino-4-hydroxy-6-hydroxymethyldihydropteridine diphosphokinase
VEYTAFIGLGSNLGDRYQYLIQAVDLIADAPSLVLVSTSSVYETDPVGYEDQDLFLNMVIEVKTDLSAEQLLANCMRIEQKLGRKREIRWGPRTIDLDILLYNQENIETEELTVPHPRMLERAFVMVPLLEICSNINIPWHSKSHSLHRDQYPNTEGVRIWKRKSGEDVFVPIES